MTLNPTTPLVLDFGTGDAIRMDIALPKAEISAHEILPAAFAMTDEVVRRSCAGLSEINRTVQCGSGCSACCHQLIPVSEYEAAHLASVTRAMPPAQRSRIVTRFTKAIAKLDSTNLLSQLTDTFAHEAHDWRKVLKLKKEYWKLAIPCPFLEDNSCSIYTHRPIACRQYLVTSKPSSCADIYSANEAHEVVLHPVDIGGALASFSGLGLQASRTLPHIFSLLAERGIRSRPATMLAAERMMGRFLDLLTTCFTRKP